MCAHLLLPEACCSIGLCSVPSNLCVAVVLLFTLIQWQSLLLKCSLLPAPVKGALAWRGSWQQAMAPKSSLHEKIALQMQILRMVPLQMQLLKMDSLQVQFLKK